MLVLAREIHDLGHLGFGDLVGVDAADTNAPLVDMQHDAGRFLAALGKKPFEDVHDKLHRRVVVVQHQNLVHRRLLRLRLWLDDDACSRTFLVPSAVVSHFDPSRWRYSPPAMILALPRPVKALSSNRIALAAAADCQGGAPLIRRGTGGSTAARPCRRSPCRDATLHRPPHRSASLPPTSLPNPL